MAAALAGPFRRPRVKAVALMTACAVALCGCVSPVAGPAGRYATPIGNAPVIANPTPYSRALVCLGEYARANHRLSPRIAVGRISDYTGKEEADGSGRKLTQGASLMAISALAKSGANLVERYDTSVSELELKYANNKLITDGAPAGPNAPTDYRKIMAGQVAGSDFFLVGGITELNFNIRSSGLDASAGNTASTTSAWTFAWSTPARCRWWMSSPTRSRSSAGRWASACSTCSTAMCSTSPPARAALSRSSSACGR